MGLGHATRSLPLIREFVKRGWEVVLGSSGRSHTFLRQEVPEARFVELPDYGLEYTDKGVELAQLAGRVPGLMHVIHREHGIVEEIVQDDELDLVISDHRYGCYSNSVPSCFISHQLKLIAPKPLRPFEFVGAGFHRWFHHKYGHVIVPDSANGREGLLSGRLSRIGPRERNYHYPGILSSLRRVEGAGEDIDLLVSISGPEPQRSVFERMVRRQVKKIPGNKIITLGLPESNEVEHEANGLTIHHHLSRSQMEDCVNRARMIVSRPGYSTLMELVEIGKKAFFVPTPGQTEQLYLAERCSRMGWFYHVPQEEFDLPRDLEIAASYHGLPRRLSTAETVENIFPLFLEMVRGR